MKYIDAEKLKAEIERQIQNLRGIAVDNPMLAQTMRLSFEGLLSLIDSLQQEQPEALHFTPLYRIIQKIQAGEWSTTVNNYARKLRDCLIKEGYRKDAEVLQGYISYMNGHNVPMATMDGQEQPEPFSCGHENGYDEAYLQEKIAKASKTWEGVDADKYLDEVRGREQEQPQVADASKMEPEVELEKASRNVYESWKGGTMDDFLRDMVELGKALNTRKEE